MVCSYLVYGLYLLGEYLVSVANANVESVGPFVFWGLACHGDGFGVIVLFLSSLVCNSQVLASVSNVRRSQVYRSSALLSSCALCAV